MYSYKFHPIMLLAVVWTMVVVVVVAVLLVAYVLVFYFLARSPLPQIASATSCSRLQ